MNLNMDAINYAKDLSAIYGGQFLLVGDDFGEPSKGCAYIGDLIEISEPFYKESFVIYMDPNEPDGIHIERDKFFYKHYDRALIDVGDDKLHLNFLIKDLTNIYWNLEGSPFTKETIIKHLTEIYNLDITTNNSWETIFNSRWDRI